MKKTNYDKIIDLTFAICFATFIIMQVNKYLIKENNLIINVIIFIIYLGIIIFVYRNSTEE